MTEFLKLTILREAINSITQKISPCRDFEILDTEETHGRVTYEAIYAKESTPAFCRSAVDGYAIIARDSFGASESMPMFFSVIGEVTMGQEGKFAVRAGEAVKIHTGGMLPKNADCVVMLENAENISITEIQINKSCAVNENVILMGEDISEGEIILPEGSQVNATAIGGCLAQGICQIKVVRKINIGIISTGDELVDPQMNIRPGQIREINSRILKAIISGNFASTTFYGVIPDLIDSLRATARKAFLESDMVVITAGSSISERDNTAKVVSELGKPGILVHGINIKPGKPTILAICDGKPIIGLPGNPVSAYVAARLVVIPVLQKLQGYANKPVDSFERALLTVNVASQAGRADFIPVRLFEKNGILYADPIFYKSNLIFSLVKAQALVIIPEDANGMGANQEVALLRI